MQPRFTFAAALAGTLACVPVPALCAADTAPSPATKGGFFSRSSKSAEKTPPTETSPQGNRKAYSPAANPANAPAAASAPRISSSTEGKTAKRGGAKKTLEAKTEDELFSAVRLQALEDPSVGELRAKADKARDKDSGIAATKAYLRGLYGKMRDLEPGLKERIDLTENAAIQGLSRTQ